ncbi:MAG TPA: sigma-70 family RNA polymerase sigma factor [Lacunisphaera sp.]
MPSPDDSNPPADDAQLLRRYAQERSEPAFTALVQRNVNLVYFAALRRVGGDRHLADDVTQRVFTDLARKAPSLLNRPVLTGWLYTSTRYAAAQAVRSEQRRRQYEQEAHAMRETDSMPAANWEQLRPVIDEALDELNERDREAVLLRYFENRPLADIGAKYRLSPDAARMRVDRALEKLRTLLARRGIASTSSALATAFIAQSGLAAPAGVIANVVSASLGQAGATTAVTLALWKILAFVTVASLGAGVIYRQARPDVSMLSTVAPNNGHPVVAPSIPSAAEPTFNQTAGPNVKIGPQGGRTTEDFGWPQVSLFAGESGGKVTHTTTEFRAKMAADPTFRETVTAQATDHLDRFYGYLFRTFDLPPSELDQFKTLLVEKELLKLDTVEAQRELGFPARGNPGLFREGLNQGQQKVDDEIKALLGDSRYIQYLQYREDLVQWTATNEVATKLEATATPLTDQQAKELVVLLRRALIRIRSPFTFDLGFGAGLFSPHIGSGLNQRVFAQAGEFLSAPQVNALRQLKGAPRAPNQ